MTNSKGKRKRLSLWITLVPALVFMFLLGWLLYCVGDKKKPEKNVAKSAERDNVTLIPIIYEETPEIVSN